MYVYIVSRQKVEFVCLEVLTSTLACCCVLHVCMFMLLSVYPGLHSHIYLLMHGMVSISWSSMPGPAFHLPATSQASVPMLFGQGEVGQGEALSQRVHIHYYYGIRPPKP